MSMDRYIGRLLDGRYEILEVIGTGGMAVVYKARCHRLNRLVAIKILKDDYSQDEEFRRRFHAESQAVAMLSHPNIVSVYDVSTADEADYIVMELIDGITLKQYMEKKGVLNWKETLHFAIQIAKALDHAHSRGIIHRDIKPHNVMVLKNGSVKVADFGIAQVMSKGNTLTKEALGSVHYISPEQAKGGRVDNRSDIYSLGVVMYEMMTGRPPYDGESPVAVAIQHINGKAAMPSTLNPNVPGGLEQIIMKAMAQEQAQRYTTAQAMLFDMDEFRKNPTILFDYNNTSTELDDAAAVASAGQAAKTAAEKVAAKSGDTGSLRTVPTKQSPSSSDRKKNRRRDEIIVEEERGGKVATIAIVLCSVAAIVAIGIFLVLALGDNGAWNSTKNMVTVPNLQNKDIYQAQEALDYVVEVDYYSYSSEYEKDRIISQSPVANTQIEKGRTIMVVVSMGPETSTKVMEELTGQEEQQAINFLKNAQGVDENLILRYYESNADVPAGQVIRTDPVKGEELVEGEVISLYISTGPTVKTMTMEDLTKDFYTEKTAINWLEMNGFYNYSIEYVDSTKSAGKVVSQSVEAGRVVDVTTVIILQISKGSENPIKLPVAGQEDPEDYISKLVDVELPAGMTEDYLLSVYRDDVLIEERIIPADAMFTQFNLTGKGVMRFRLEVEDGDIWTITVDFDAVEEDTGEGIGEETND